MTHRTSIRMTVRGALGVSAMSMALALTAAAQAGQKSWTQMRGEVVSAEDVLSADVTNGVAHVSEVRELVLSSDGSRVQYVLYEVPYPYQPFDGRDGFTTFERLDFAPGRGAGVDVRFADEAAHRAPDQLTLTAGEADHRLVSNVLSQPMYFSDDETREIVDVLIDRETGELTHYVVEMEQTSLFNRELRAIPADSVEIDEAGGVHATIGVGGVAQVAQPYDESFL